MAVDGEFAGVSEWEAPDRKGYKKCVSIGHASFSKANSNTNSDTIANTNTDKNTVTNTNTNDTPDREYYKRRVSIGHASFSKDISNTDSDTIANIPTNTGRNTLTYIQIQMTQLTGIDKRSVCRLAMQAFQRIILIQNRNHCKHKFIHIQIQI